MQWCFKASMMLPVPLMASSFSLSSSCGHCLGVIPVCCMPHSSIDQRSMLSYQMGTIAEEGGWLMPSLYL